MMPPRSYGPAPYRVVVVHGGPGAAGSAAGLARGLSRFVSVLEPFQSADSLAGQVAELHHQVNAHAAPPVALVGWSWGAMLAWIVAASFPAVVSKLVLVAPAALDENDAAGIMPERLRRLTSSDQQRVAELSSVLRGATGAEKDEALAQLARCFEAADSYDRVDEETNEAVEVNAGIYESVWNDAVVLRRSGALMEHASTIECPVTIIHGDHDPHPIDALRRVPHVEVITLERCGHTLGPSVLHATNSSACYAQQSRWAHPPPNA